jgi:hypothetical protein
MRHCFEKFYVYAHLLYQMQKQNQQGHRYYMTRTRKRAIGDLL